MANKTTPTSNDTTENVANMVHEAEAQRQYVRVNLPAAATIENEHYKLEDWSVGGISLLIPSDMTKLPSYIREDALLDTQLHFMFDGFALNIPVQLRVQHVDTSKGKIGCEYENMPRNQRIIMQYLVTAYACGELVQVGDLLNVVSRNNMTKSRSVPDPNAGLSDAEIAKRKMGKLFRVGVLALISVLLLAYILASVYERLYIVKATSAQVAATMLTVDTPAGGKVYYSPILPDTMVKKGTPLLTISTTSNNTYTVDSPCNCIVKKRLLDNNRLANKGEPALELVRPDTIPYVEAYIGHKDAVKLSIGQKALLALPGHNEYQHGIIKIIQAGKGMGGNSLIRIEPLSPLPVEYVDDPVEIRVDTMNLL